MQTTMRRQGKPFRMVPALLALTAVLGGTSSANASPFDALGAGLTLENTIPDLDLYQLTQFVGSVPGTPLTYGATITATGFTAFMSGTYAGQSLNVSYTGNSSAFPGGAVTWTSTGSYGTSTWTGSGSAAFTFPTTTTFTESYTSSLVLGTNTGSANLHIDGLDAPFIVYADATGSIVANGDPKDTYPTIKDPDNPKGDELTSDDVCLGVLKGKKCHGKEVIQSADVVFTGPPEIVDSGTIRVVPEPGSLGVLATAVLLAGCARVSRRKTRR